jgi:squalene-associated FAD-dependent desaturase
VALAEAGHQVHLYESKRFLGGRVYSMAAPRGFPCALDNGPHTILGGYRHTLGLLKKLGRNDLFHWVDPLAFEWLLPGGAKVHLRAASLPAPFHLLGGLIRSNAFPSREKASLALALFRLRFGRRPGMTVSAFMKTVAAGPAAHERFWGPITRAVMNVSPEQAPIDALATVFRKAFYERCSDSAMGIPRVPLSALLQDSLRRFLADRGGTVHLGDGLRNLHRAHSGLEGATARGKTLQAEAWVLAVPPNKLSALLPGEDWARPFSHLGASPIVSAHFHLNHPVLSVPLLGLSGASFEWVFNRNINIDLRIEGQVLSLVSSASRDLLKQRESDILSLAWRDLRDRCPEAQKAQILAGRVTREPSATFAWTAETGPLRPGPLTPIPGVVLAGDWTATGLPATLESAVLSGRKAAEVLHPYSINSNSSCHSKISL